MDESHTLKRRREEEEQEDPMEEEGTEGVPGLGAAEAEDPRPLSVPGLSRLLAETLHRVTLVESNISTLAVNQADLVKGVKALRQGSPGQGSGRGGGYGLGARRGSGGGRGRSASARGRGRAVAVPRRQGLSPPPLVPPQVRTQVDTTLSEAFLSQDAFYMLFD